MGLFGSKEESAVDDDVAVLSGARGPLPPPPNANVGHRRGTRSNAHFNDGDDWDGEPRRALNREINNVTNPDNNNNNGRNVQFRDGGSSAAPVPRLHSRPTGTFTFRERLSRDNHVGSGLWLSSGGRFELRDEECEPRGKGGNGCVRTYTVARGTYTTGEAGSRFAKVRPTALRVVGSGKNPSRPDRTGDAERNTVSADVLAADPTAEAIRFNTESVLVRRTELEFGDPEDEESALFIAGDPPRDFETPGALAREHNVDTVVYVRPRELRFMGVSRNARVNDMLGDDVPHVTAAHTFRVVEVRGVPSVSSEMFADPKDDGGPGTLIPTPEIYPCFDRVLPDARVGDIRATWEDVQL